MSARDIPEAVRTLIARAADMVRRLAAPGRCRFALDHFDTGATSLTDLNSLPFAWVKLDASLIHDILTSPRSALTVRGITELGRGHGLETVAEHIEDEAVAAALRGLGVDDAGGYAAGEREALEEIHKVLCRMNCTDCSGSCSRRGATRRQRPRPMCRRAATMRRGDK